MNFPKFWARGEAQGVRAWGWSNEGLAQAAALGGEVAQRIAARLACGNRSQLGRYEYGERPLREEVLREFREGTEAPAAVITRNSYGCLVLNTARLLFVDVDIGEAPRQGGVLGRLFGSKKAVSRHEDARQFVLEQAAAWAGQNANWGWRVYRTRAGLRLAAIHRPFAPEEKVCALVFEALGADPLYRRLCGHQQCFRARLTPKPWRCNVPNPPARWPFEDERAAVSFQRWEKVYLSAANEYATCELIAKIGTTVVSPELTELIATHDEATRCESSLPLA
jgi:hypothetical protein